MEERLVAYQYGAEKHQLYLNHYQRHFQHSLDVTSIYWNLAFTEVGLYDNGETSFQKDKLSDWIWIQLS